MHLQPKTEVVRVFIQTRNAGTSRMQHRDVERHTIECDWNPKTAAERRFLHRRRSDSERQSAPSYAETNQDRESATNSGTVGLNTSAHVIGVNGSRVRERQRAELTPALVSRTNCYERTRYARK